MPTLKSAALMLAAILGLLIAADIAGALVSLVFEILPLRGVSTPLFYAIWFVDGAFCGIFIYLFAGGIISPKGQGVESSAAPVARRAGLLVILTTAAILVGLCFLCHQFAWDGAPDDHYVPDSMALSITFFAAILPAMIFAHVRPPARDGTSTPQQ